MTVGLSSQLIVPITLWGNKGIQSLQFNLINHLIIIQLSIKAPTHCISSIFLTIDHKTLVTGCNDGQICLWDIIYSNAQSMEWNLMPRTMLFGHSSPILCLANGSLNPEKPLLISSSETGYNITSCPLINN